MRDLNGLKPINIVQAAEEDFRRHRRNAAEAECRKPHYEPYAFHRHHVRRARSVAGLLTLALMDPAIGTRKPNTQMIYGDAVLLVAALRLVTTESREAA